MAMPEGVEEALFVSGILRCLVPCLGAMSLGVVEDKGSSDLARNPLSVPQQAYGHTLPFSQGASYQWNQLDITLFSRKPLVGRISQDIAITSSSEMGITTFLFGSGHSP